MHSEHEFNRCISGGCFRLLLVAWRLTSMLMDLVLLVIIVTGLVVYRCWPFKRKT